MEKFETTMIMAALQADFDIFWAEEEKQFPITFTENEKKIAKILSRLAHMRGINTALTAIAK